MLDVHRQREQRFSRGERASILNEGEFVDDYERCDVSPCDDRGGTLGFAAFGNIGGRPAESGGWRPARSSLTAALGTKRPGKRATYA